MSDSWSRIDGPRVVGPSNEETEAGFRAWCDGWFAEIRPPLRRAFMNGALFQSQNQKVAQAMTYSLAIPKPEESETHATPPDPEKRDHKAHKRGRKS